MAIEALRGDLEWLGAVVARLDGEPPPAPSGLARRRARAAPRRCWAGPTAGIPTSSTTRSPRGARRCRRRSGAPRRRELARSMGAPARMSLWAHRFRLSRLQAHVAARTRRPTASSPRRRSAGPVGPGPPTGCGTWRAARRAGRRGRRADGRPPARRPPPRLFRRRDGGIRRDRRDDRVPRADAAAPRRAPARARPRGPRAARRVRPPVGRRRGHGLGPAAEPAPAEAPRPRRAGSARRP